LDKINDSVIKRNFLQVAAVTNIALFILHLALYGGEWPTSPPSHFTHGETAQSWFGCFGNQLFEQASIPLPTNYTNEIIYQKVNATLMNSTESITATTVPVTT